MNNLDPLNIPLKGLNLIEASAGTGKTYAISNIYLQLLVEGNFTVEEILVVTFSKSCHRGTQGSYPWKDYGCPSCLVRQ